ncbi:alpha/beta hydrolase [Roseomonas sp. BN140053]|uniref:alpha/beta hydrolase n=1 Tax=Roseomonas sp. BN140053 TaxID=3391898 RepID=UPI0039E87C0E
MNEERGVLDRGDGAPLAWAALSGRGPRVVFLGGFRSDMEGSKALFLRDRCAESGHAFLRLDYSGHGVSGGMFEDGTVGRWAEDAAAIIEARAPGPVVLVGSSMGGWIALLLARRWGESRVRAVVGLAAAPDFTEDLMPADLSAAEREALARDGVVRRPSPYGEPLPITARLLEEGRNHLLLRGPIPFTNPVRLLQGMADPDVPWRHALRIVEALAGADVALTLIKDGDHRLSRPEDLTLLWRKLLPLLGQDGG